MVRKLVNSFFNSDIRDIMTGYRAFSAQFVKSFPVISKGFEIETEMTVYALDKNMKIQSIPVMYRDRPAGSVSKLSTVTDGIRVLKKIFKLIRLSALAFFGICALILLRRCGAVCSLLVTYLKPGLCPAAHAVVCGIWGAVDAGFSAAHPGHGVQKHRQLHEYSWNHRT